MYLFFHSSMTSPGKPVIRALNLAGGEWRSWVKTSWRKEVVSGGNRGGGLGPKQITVVSHVLPQDRCTSHTHFQ